MTPAQYVRLSKMTISDLARRMGVSRAQASRLVYGQRAWTVACAIRMEEISDGRVRAADLLSNVLPRGYRIVREEPAP